MKTWYNNKFHLIFLIDNECIDNKPNRNVYSSVSYYMKDIFIYIQCIEFCLFWEP